MKKMSLYSVPSNIKFSRLTFKDSKLSSYSTINNEGSPAQEPNSLHYFYSALFATILEDILMEFKILGECNNTMHILKVRADIHKYINKKFNIENRQVVDELDTIDRKNLEKEEYKIHKIENDRKLVVDLLLNTYVDLCLNRSFNFLAKTVANFNPWDKHLADLTLDESSNRSIRRDLAKNLRQQRNHIRTVNYDTDIAIDLLRNQIEDATVTAETRSRYITKWQIARIEQHKQSIKDKDGVPAEKVEFYKQKIDQEQRIHQEIELLLAIDCLRQIDDWMSKYDKDIETADLNVQIMKNRYQNQRDERIELEKTIAKHKHLIEDWTSFKDDRAKANAYRAKMQQSAITVQAWWRGLLVRLELGPFRVAKKKGGGRKKT